MAQSDNKKYFEKEHDKNRAEWKSADANNTAGINPTKMLYVKHDLRSNYHSASGDEKMKHDIMMSEIAKLIVERTDEVVALLDKYGLRVPKKPSHKHLVKAVTHGLHRSRKFTADIARLIARGGKPMSADGDKPTQDYGKIIDSSSSFLDSIGKIFGGKKKARAQAAKDKAEADKLRAQAELERAKAEAALHGAVKGMGGDLNGQIVKYIAIGLGVAILVGGVVWYVKFKK